MKRADRQFSGRRDARIEVSVGEVESWALSPFSSAAGAGVDGTGTENSEMIWSASLRRSEDRSGDRFLICRTHKLGHFLLAFRAACLRLLLEHIVEALRPEDIV